MNWTSESDLFINALDDLQEFREGESTVKTDDLRASYYSDYSNGYHMESAIMDYSVSNTVELRKALDELWRNKDPKLYERIKRISLHAYKCSQPSSKRRLSDVEMYNYTI